VSRFAFSQYDSQHDRCCGSRLLLNYNLYGALKSEIHATFCSFVLGWIPSRLSFSCAIVFRPCFDCTFTR
jgi:hypothetical protein